MTIYAKIESVLVGLSQLLDTKVSFAHRNQANQILHRPNADLSPIALKKFSGGNKNIFSSDLSRSLGEILLTTASLPYAGSQRISALPLYSEICHKKS